MRKLNPLHPKQAIKKPNRQSGFSLLEVLIAALIFSLCLLGFLQYHQVLLQTFQRTWQLKQAWSLAHQNLEAFSVDAVSRAIAMPPTSGWRQDIQAHPSHNGCQLITATVFTPQDQRAQLSRLVCTQESL